MWRIDQKEQRRRDFVAKDLRTPKYRMRVAKSVKHYSRSSEKINFQKMIHEAL